MLYHSQGSEGLWLIKCAVLNFSHFMWPKQVQMTLLYLAFPYFQLCKKDKMSTSTNHGFMHCSTRYVL